MKKIHLIILFFAPAFLFAQLLPVKQNGKWGYVNAQGDLIIPATFIFADQFQSGRAMVGTESGVGIMDAQGSWLIKPEFEYISWIDSNVFAAKKTTEWYLYNMKGQQLKKLENGKIKSLDLGQYSFVEEDKTGFFHLENGIILKPSYDEILAFKSNKAHLLIKKENKKGIVSRSGVELLKPEFDSIAFEKNYYLVKKDSFWGIYDTIGNLVLKPCAEKIEIVNEKLAYYRFDNSKNLYNLQTKKAIMTKIFEVKPMDNYVIINYEDNNSGIVDYDGNILTDNFRKILPYFENKVKVLDSVEANWGIYDIDQRKLILPCKYSMIEYPENNMSIVKIKDQFGVINTNMEELVEPMKVKVDIHNNEIRVKSEKGLLLVETDGKGKVLDRLQHNNFKSLRVSPDRERFDQGTTTGRAVNNLVLREKLNDSLYWKIDKNNRFGIYNINADSFILKPIYVSFQNYNELGYSIANLNTKKSTSMMGEEGKIVKSSSQFLIIKNSVGKRISGPDYMYIYMTDFTVDSLPFARCVFKDGSYGLLDKNFQVVKKNMVYIGKFSSGVARFTTKGRVNVVHESKTPYYNETYNDFASSISSFAPVNLRYGYRRDEKNVLVIEYPEWAVMDSLGNVLHNKIDYSYIGEFFHDRAIAFKNGKWGVINKRNEIVIPFQYDKISYLENTDNRLFKVEKNKDLYGCINSKAEVIVEVNYDQVKEIHDGMISVRKNGNWGFTNVDGMEKIPCIYRSVKPFSEGLAAVYIKGKWGFVDKEGNMVIPAKYYAVGMFSEGLAWVQEKPGIIDFINPKNEIVFQIEALAASNFVNTFSIIKTENGYGFIDKNGQWVLKPSPKFDMIHQFNEYGISKAKIGDKYVLINNKGEIISKKYALIDPFYEGFARVRPNNYLPNQQVDVKYGMINLSGREIIEAKFSNLSKMSCGRVVFYDENRKYGVLDSNANTIIKAQYFSISDFRDGRAIVYNSPNESGIINVEGNFVSNFKQGVIRDINEDVAMNQKAYANYVIQQEDQFFENSTQYEKVSKWEEEIIAVCNKNKWGVVNKYGIDVLSGRYQHIGPFVNGVAKVKLNSRTGVFDLDGKVIVLDDTEEVLVAENNMFRVNHGNAIGYFDRKGNWIWPLAK